MARPRKTSLDAFIDAYLDLSPDERPLAMAMLRGAERVLNGRKAKEDTTDAEFEEIGERAVVGAVDIMQGLKDALAVTKDKEVKR